MKLQVNVKVQTGKQTVTSADRTLDLVVGPEDTISSLKERILMVEPVPFPDTSLIFGGIVLCDGQRLVDCGVKEGASLDFVVRASEKAFTQQLRELLQVRALTPNELSLLYCNQYGITVSQALGALGREEQLHDFLEREKSFSIENGCVTALCPEEAKKPAQVTRELRPILEEGPISCESASTRPHIALAVTVTLQSQFKNDEVTSLSLAVTPGDTVLSLKERIAASELIPFSERALFLGESELGDGQKLAECGIKEGSSVNLVVRVSDDAFAQQLSELLRGRTLSTNELSLLYCYKHGASVTQALKILGRSEKFQDFVKGQSYFSAANGCVSLGQRVGAQKSLPWPISLDLPQNQWFLDLHAKIGGTAFQDELTQALNQIVDVCSEAMFLNVHHVVKAGSVGRCTAIKGVTDAEVVFFLNGLPKVSPVMCFSALVKSVASGLQEHLDDGSVIKEVRVGVDSVHVRGEGAVAVDLRFSPVFDSYRDALQELASKGPDTHPCPKWSLVEQRLLFTKRQPEAVRVTMRLLKWWREQQKWSSARTRPGDEILELVAAYSASQSQASDQRDAVLAAMSFLAHFDELRVIWPESSQ
mmetsp:Transcript_82081/g.166171  ORF Transcript_82081/g.166171 Transcript_82081/m.166171 type:complete len:591 (+) Transcript_82081:103-1875(+)